MASGPRAKTCVVSLLSARRRGLFAIKYTVDSGIKFGGKIGHNKKSQVQLSLGAYAQSTSTDYVGSLSFLPHQAW